MIKAQNPDSPRKFSKIVKVLDDIGALACKNLQVILAPESYIWDLDRD
ncbi:hypothetical protein [uncultured Helicobacter sp.]|nr:hypothetical protein [uncultured Helicobacter sp.]